MRVLQCRRGTIVVNFLYSVLTYNATQQFTLAVLHNSFAVILSITIIIIFLPPPPPPPAPAPPPRPVIFIAGRPKSALLFWFFGDFRCGALLFMVIYVIYKYKNR